jgi:hypothetical protein
VSTNYGTSMQDNLATLGPKTLREICLPGSHDCGMSQHNAHTALAFPCAVVTQTTGILGQLQNGSRYFDLRPVISSDLSGDNLWAGHYSVIDSAISHAANGQSFQSIIADVNAFCATSQELIVLKLSHAYDTNTPGIYPDFTQAQWSAALNILVGVPGNGITPIADLFAVPVGTDLWTLDLNSFIGTGKAAVVIVASSAVLPTTPVPAGVCYASQYPLVNEYSDTDSESAMQTDQLAKLASFWKAGTAGGFLVSWTLTQQGRVRQQRNPGKANACVQCWHCKHALAALRCQNTTFIASCMIRGSCALVIWPNVDAVLRVAAGLLRRVAFNTLNASARNSRRSFSRMRNSRTSAVSNWKNRGPLIFRTPRFPKVPRPACVNAAGFNQLTQGERLAQAEP